MQNLNMYRSMTQNWCFRNCQNRRPIWRNRGPILGVVLRLMSRKNRHPKWENRRSIFSWCKNKKHKRIL